jgi:hypothetical protein
MIWAFPQRRSRFAAVALFLQPFAAALPTYMGCRRTAKVFPYYR